MVFYETDLIVSLCKKSFFQFVKEFWSTIIEEAPVFNWHVELLCNELQVMAERVFLNQPKLYDLIINVPPGSTKSTIVSQMFPAWVWTRMASAKFICASYAYQVAIKDSLRTRDIVESELYRRCFGAVELREDENTKGMFTTTKKGFRLSAGIGGAITGFHGHFLIVDDPLNPEESFSEPELKAANRWMEQTLPSRKVDKKVTPLILVQQRLHQSDPTGEMLEKADRAKRKGEPTMVRHICLPGELTEHVNPPELAANYVDGLLDPHRLPDEVLKKMQSELGDYAYAAQVLQHPVPLGGGMFKTDRIVEATEPPHRKKILRIVRSWDKAGTANAGKYTVGVLLAAHVNGTFWVLDVKRDRLGSREREVLIRQTAEEDGDDIEIALEIEGGSGGKESGENTVSNLAGFKVVLIRPTGDKEARAYPFSSQVGAGNVVVLKRPWTVDFINELKFFPNGKYKDQVDAASQAFNRIARRKKKIGGF